MTYARDDKDDGAKPSDQFLHYFDANVSLIGTARQPFKPSSSMQDDPGDGDHIDFYHSMPPSPVWIHWDLYRFLSRKKGLWKTTMCAYTTHSSLTLPHLDSRITDSASRTKCALAPQVTQRP